MIMTTNYDNTDLIALSFFYRLYWKNLCLLKGFSIFLHMVFKSN